MPPVAFASFSHRNFRYFWFSGLISNSGRFFQFLALPAAIWALTESPGWVGFAGFAQFIPMAVIAPLAGQVADRYPRRNLLLITQFSMSLVGWGLAIVWWSGVRDPLAYVGLAALTGFAGGMNLPAWQAFVTELVPRDLLLNAVTLSSAQFNSSRLIGPTLAGVTVAAWGPGAAFAINALSYVVVLGALVRIDAPGVVSRQRAGAMRPVRDFVSIARYIRERRGITTAIGVVALIGFLGLPMQVMAVVFAEDVFDRGAQGFGLMLALVGLGAVIATPIVASLDSRVRRSSIQTAALVLYGAAVVTFAIAPNLEISLIPLACVGAAHLTSASVLNTTVQMQVDESRRAQTVAVYLMVLLFANPLGQLVLGQLVELLGARPAFGLYGTLLLVVVVGLRGLGVLRRLDIAAPSGTPVAPESPRGASAPGVTRSDP